MPSKRDVLAHLTRAELLEAADLFELTVGDRRVRDQLVDAVASSKKAGLAEVLAPLSRDRLKEVYAIGPAAAAHDAGVEPPPPMRRDRAGGIRVQALGEGRPGRARRPASGGDAGMICLAGSG